jgi:hypothetical protein
MTLTRREQAPQGDIKAGDEADLNRWSYLEKNVDNVMWKLEEGLDMKTVKLDHPSTAMLLANFFS